MATILVHAAAATAGGGLTYYRQLLSRLGEVGERHHWLVLAPAGSDAPERLPDNIELFTDRRARQPMGRLYVDQVVLRRFIRRRRVDAILATGNFGLLRPPAPQILLCRNALYFSKTYASLLSRRGEVGELVNLMLRRKLAIASVQSSDINVTPTAAFANQIRESAGGVEAERFHVIPHGFDHERFVQPGASLDPRIAGLLMRRPGVKRVLLVSHYNYFRNFETTLRAMAILRQRMVEPVELILTTKLGEGRKDHRYDTSQAARLMESLGIVDIVTMLGTLPANQLYPLYQVADVVVCPSLVESFGHPLVEAMASGRPVVASDQPVPRELAGVAALYFAPLDAEALATRLEQALTLPALAERMIQAGLRRAKDFSWNRHFFDVVATVEAAIGSRSDACPRPSAA